MNARKSLTAATISTVAMFSLFGANIAQAAPGGNGNGRNESIDLGPAPVQLHNDRAEVKNDCPTDDAWWHFVLAPNNGQYEFSSLNLNIGGTATLVAGDDIVTNGGQTDNVFVAVPAGADLNDLGAAGSSAMVAPYSMNVKFVLSHVCEGSEVIEEEPVVDEEVIEDPAVDDEPVADDDVTEDDEEVIEEEAIEEDRPTEEVNEDSDSTDENVEEDTASEEPADEIVTDIVTPTPDTEAVEDVVEEIVDNNEPVIEDESTVKTLEEAPAVEEVNETVATPIDEIVKVATVTEEAPAADIEPEVAVAADHTDRNALPATGMELSLAFLGLGLAGLGGTLLAARRRLTII